MLLMNVLSLNPPANVLISRTDSIGDVVLTLPLAKLLKDRFPEMSIAFLGKSYTRAVIESCSYIDEFIDVTDFLEKTVTIGSKTIESILHVFPQKAIAKRAVTLGVPIRIGTTNRLYHWMTCNRLVHLSRKNSPLHEAQLNAKLLRAFGINRQFTLTELGNSFGLSELQTLAPKIAALIDPRRFNLILHPKSQGSAREWGLDNFIQLIKLLPKDRYKIFISGTEKERELLATVFEEVGDFVTDICGTMGLAQFISFINNADGLIANSTGPLHIAAALKKYAIGIYPNVRPMHPGRWQPLGPHAHFVSIDSLDMQSISPNEVMQKLEQARQTDAK